jgi:hypothetical protein
MEISKPRKFSKSVNKNDGYGVRGIVHIDIIAPNLELADKMEHELVELGFDSAYCGDDIGNGFVFSMMIETKEIKDFNKAYRDLKNKLN